MRTLYWITILLVICGCKQTGPGAAEKEASSPLKELLEAVQKAEAEGQGKELQQMKADVADAAKRVFSRRRIEDFAKDPKDPEDFGSDFHRVNVRDGVFVVTGDNYFWRLTPVMEQGRVKEVLVEAGPICEW